MPSRSKPANPTDGVVAASALHSLGVTTHTRAPASSPSSSWHRLPQSSICAAVNAPTIRLTVLAIAGGMHGYEIVSGGS